jgi:transcriptional regulator of acetoin/glycerol metabolism
MVQAIRFSAAAGRLYERTALSPGGGQFADPADLRDLPAVFVVCRDDLEALRSRADLVHDRGTRHGAKNLKAYFLGQQSLRWVAEGRVPFLDAPTYRVPLRLVSAVEKFLVSARRSNSSGWYILGVDQRLFQHLWSAQPRDGVVERLHGPCGAGTAPSPRFDRAGLRQESRPSRPARKVPAQLLEQFGSELKDHFGGASPEAQDVREMILIAASSNAPVLIQGDTGTGKERVASGIHRCSGRQGRFIAVNCAAIPRELFESELFGAVPSGFHGAINRPGLWELAKGGTLFLDEIADLDGEHQAKILRVLQEKKLRRVGGFDGRKEAEIDVGDVRVIAATNRKDLYYRLAVLPIRTPNLLEDPLEVGHLAQRFWGEIAGAGKTLPADVIATLGRRRWPGNVRQLKATLYSLHAQYGADATLSHLIAVFDYLSENQCRQRSAGHDPARRVPVSPAGRV